LLVEYLGPQRWRVALLGLLFGDIGLQLASRRSSASSSTWQPAVARPAIC
jgi:hypothetical protein